MMKRYFDDSTALKPGEISEDLRHALGIGKRSLPIWIHRMRVLGYPPGWLRKADMTNTTIKLFDGFENELEEGETDDSVKYNPDSFFEYPGFNAPLPSNVKDDYEKLGMPPMQPFQQLKFAKQTIQSIKPVPYKRFKLSNDNKDEGETSDSEEEDETQKKEINFDENQNVDTPSCSNKTVIALDDDDDDENSIIELNSSPCKDKTSSKDLSSNNSVINCVNEQSSEENLNEDESDIIVLDTKKDSSEINLTYTETSTSVIDSDKSIKLSDNLNLTIDSKEKEKIFETNSPDKSSDIINEEDEEDTKSISSKITLVSMGAPVPASLNGEKPPLENFAVGMGEMIYFENLPTSTGVFNKMRKVIKKIRKKLSS